MLTPELTRRDTGELTHSDLPLREPDAKRVAVMLNGGARKVTERLARKFERIVGRDHLFYSRSLEEAESFAREIVSRGYGTVVCGGGDGTLVQTVNLIDHHLRRSNQWRQDRYKKLGEVQPLLAMPRFAFLRLGTGNAMGYMLGSGHPANDLRRLMDHQPGRTQNIPLVASERERFFFSGIGHDSLILNDYAWLKERAQHPLLRPFTTGVLGYLLAGFGRTLPRVLFGRDLRLEARITTVGRGYYVDPRRGDFIDPIEPGTVIFEGSASFVGASTVPYFGYRFKAFPFGRMHPEFMNLRVATIGALGSAWNIRPIWSGTYRHPKQFFDFLVEGAHVELARPFPWQHSGDDQGKASELFFQVAPEPLKLVDFQRAQPFA